MFLIILDIYTKYIINTKLCVDQLNYMIKYHRIIIHIYIFHKSTGIRYIAPLLWNIQTGVVSCTHGICVRRSQLVRLVNALRVTSAIFGLVGIHIMITHSNPS